jgi:hypothetical protein
MVDIPESFLCPITSDIMVSPMMTRSGLSFDRSAILEWLCNHGNTCPLTRAPLCASNLVPNHQLRLRIEQWCMEHGHELLRHQVLDEESSVLVTCVTTQALSRRRSLIKALLNMPGQSRDTHGQNSLRRVLRSFESRVFSSRH